MHKTEAWTFIKYHQKKTKTNKEIHEDMLHIVADDFPSNASAKKWASTFKLSNDRTNDPRSSNRETSNNEEQVDAIHRWFLGDRRLTVQQRANSTGISSDLVHTALTNTLGIDKLYARWVPKILTPDDKLKRGDIFRTLLTRFQTNSMNFSRKWVTQDKTWVHLFKPESAIQRKQ